MIFKFMALVALLALAVRSDLMERKIPNRLTVPFMLIGLGLNTILDFPKGIQSSLIGFAIGFLVFLIPYMMKGMGAGDVKLMASIGAITNGSIILYITLFTALFGGLISLIIKIKTNDIKRTITNAGKLLLHIFFWILFSITLSPRVHYFMTRFKIEKSENKSDYIPYAVAIALGTLMTVFLTIFGNLPGVSI